MVTHQLQVERRTAKGHRPKTDALPLDYATNYGVMYTFPKLRENPPTAVGVGAHSAEEQQNTNVEDNEGDYTSFYVETVT